MRLPSFLKRDDALSPPEDFWMRLRRRRTERQQQRAAKIIDFARQQAAQRSLPWGPSPVAWRESWFGSSWGVRCESDLGTVIMLIARRMMLFDVKFHPTPRDERGWLLPLWLAFPNYNSVTMGWRMGSGEDYKYRWHAFWRGLTGEQKSAYRARYPEPPAEDLAWQDWYDEVAETPARSRDSIADFVIGRV